MEKYLRVINDDQWSRLIGVWIEQSELISSDQEGKHEIFYVDWGDFNVLRSSVRNEEISMFVEGLVQIGEEPTEINEIRYISKLWRG